MSKRSAGVAFCFIAVILYLAREFILLQKEYFTDRSYGELIVFSIISLITGIVYLVQAEKKNGEANKPDESEEQ